ncbi:HAMP domain-containing sensor histidine kinase [Bradyrhizobium sp.]|uniref:sensor histidine kinase n=1 Tax=Bradyrhizobium sp. TaxID=376 RepID=UPI00262A3A6E|nr:HAMP domain-containing sensor histidine kinase [Bradyrhizobium sp.]
MILILLSGLVISHLLAGWFYTAERQQAVRAISGYAAAQRIANLARLIDEAPEDWRARIVAAASDPTLRVSLSAQPRPDTQTAPDTADRSFQRYLAEQLPPALATGLRVAVSGTLGPPFAGMGPGGPMFGRMIGRGAPMFARMMGPGIGRFGDWRSMRASIRLTNGQFLLFNAALPESGPSTSWQFLVAMLLMSGIVVLASLWAVRRVTAPLGTVIRAAERLGRDVNAPPIVEAGSREMRQAAQVFNEMQARLQRILETRTRMLAALSHDLRTPLTLLRLRLEALPEREERDRMLANIADLDVMIAAILNFARDEAATEPLRRTDLTALLMAIVDDMADAGLAVSMTPTESVILECRPGALRRVVSNLLDNALKYGKTARVELLASPSTITIAIDDEGPGIPEAERQNVFEPFYRLEPSRSRETGGTGLGLAIAQSIAQANGGQITLINRAAGGLRAVLSLPR